MLPPSEGEGMALGPDTVLRCRSCGSTDPKDNVTNTIDPRWVAAFCYVCDKRTFSDRIEVVSRPQEGGTVS